LGYLAEGRLAVEQLTTVRRDRACRPVLVVTGEVDLAVVPAFRSALHQLIADAHSPAYVDLTGVTFFDSSGIKTLLDAQVRADDAHVRLVISPSRPVLRTLEIVGLATTFRQETPPPSAALHAPAPVPTRATAEPPPTAGIRPRLGACRYSA